ncbi:MAG: hypothetical protein ACYC7D_00975 [Nitrososphaerales archaeon]
MISILGLYAFTTLLFAASIPLLYFTQAFTILRLVLILFILDILLTLEAAYVSDVISIAFLHIITIPAFFALIYFDLLRHHRSEFRCFLCEKEIEVGEQVESVKKMVNRRNASVNVHASCLEQRPKSISERGFRRGIPK